MKKTEQVYRELLFQKMERKVSRFRQKELAHGLGISLTNVNQRLACYGPGPVGRYQARDSISTVTTGASSLGLPKNQQAMIAADEVASLSEAACGIGSCLEPRTRHIYTG